jgi:hypothetical protein
MSFKDLIETSQAIALSDRLHPTELSVWRRYCRIYSKKFSEPLSQVLTLDPEMVITEIFADQFDELKLDEQEHLDHILDIIGSLENPNYDLEKERAERESLRKLEEEEELRVKEGRAIHQSLEKDKLKFSKEESKLPTSGGLNMKYINQLQNEESENGEF